MSHFSLDQSEELLKGTEARVANGLDSFEAKRIVLYDSLFACEITLKALLEKAGKSFKDIRKLGHSQGGLLRALGECKIQAKVVRGSLYWVPASRVRAETVDKDFSDATIGKMLTGKDFGTSKYPNKIRYGDHFTSYPPEIMLKTAKKLLEWAHKHWPEIRL